MKKICDHFFGILKYDSISQFWCCKKKLSSGRFITVYLNTGFVPTVKLINSFISSFKIVRKNEKRLKTIAVKRLRNIYHNYGWSNGKTISEVIFMKRMKPESIILHIDGSADITYDDGGLFQGHTIYIGVKKNGKFKDTCFQG